VDRARLRMRLLRDFQPTSPAEEVSRLDALWCRAAVVGRRHDGGATTDVRGAVSARSCRSHRPVRANCARQALNAAGARKSRAGAAGAGSLRRARSIRR
jgi:hypothetical protein